MNFLCFYSGVSISKRSVQLRKEEIKGAEIERQLTSFLSSYARYLVDDDLDAIGNMFADDCMHFLMGEMPAFGAEG